MEHTSTLIFLICIAHCLGYILVPSKMWGLRNGWKYKDPRSEADLRIARAWAALGLLCLLIIWMFFFARERIGPPPQPVKEHRVIDPLL